MPLIDFQQADVSSPEDSPGALVLRVRGVKPTAEIDVRLLPVQYIRAPEFWAIQVSGSSHTSQCVDRAGSAPTGSGSQDSGEEREYEVILDVTSILGTEGIEVLGASTSVRIPVARSNRSHEAPTR